MTTIDAARWFYTQPVSSLTNALSRAALIELLADPVTALAILRNHYPLRQANDGQYAALRRAITANSELLARLSVDWYNPLEIAVLNSVLTTTYPGAVMAGDPSLYYKFDESSGPLVNHGSLGSALNATVANATFNQSGPNTTVPKAYTFNGTTTLITLPTSADLASSDWTVALLVNETGKGESNLGTYFEFDTTAGASAITAALRHSNSTSQFVASVRNTADTATNWITDSDVSFNIWSWLFMQYNNTTKRVTAWKSVSSQLTAFTVTDTALSGTARQIGGGFIGNDSAGARTLAGKMSQFMLYPSALTTTQLQNIITASGV